MVGHPAAQLPIGAQADGTGAQPNDKAPGQGDHQQSSQGGNQKRDRLEASDLKPGATP